MSIKTFADVDDVAHKTKVAMVKRAIRDGLTQREAAERLGATTSNIGSFCSVYGIKWRRQKKVA